MIRSSELASYVNGDVYKNGLRPFGSELEDIIVSFSAGIDGQSQSGMVSVRIYVKDIDFGSGDGRLVQNTARCEAIEVKALQVIQSLIDNSAEYDLSVETTIQTLPVEDLGQHVVYVMLKYRRVTI
jgi:hypothetical protein